MLDKVGVVLATIISLSTLTLNILTIIEKLTAIRMERQKQQKKRRIHKRIPARHRRRTRQ